MRRAAKPPASPRRSLEWERTDNLKRALNRLVDAGHRPTPVDIEKVVAMGVVYADGRFEIGRRA